VFYTLPFLKTRSSIDVFLALYDYSSGCSFPSFISPLLNFSGYCIITLVVSIILCQYQFAKFTISLDIVYRMDIVYMQCDCHCFLPARRYASAGYSDRNVSVRLSVRHAPVLCQNEESYRHDFFTIW